MSKSAKPETVEKAVKAIKSTSPAKAEKIIMESVVKTPKKSIVTPSKPLVKNEKVLVKTPTGNASVPLQNGASKPKSLQALMRSKGGFIKLP